MKSIDIRKSIIAVSSLNTIDKLNWRLYTTFDPPDETSNLKTFSLRYQINRVIPTKVAEMRLGLFDVMSKACLPVLLQRKSFRFLLVGEDHFVSPLKKFNVLYTERVHELTGYF